MGPFKGRHWWTVFLCAGILALTGCRFSKLLFQVNDGMLDPKYGAREGSERDRATITNLNSDTH